MLVKTICFGTILLLTLTVSVDLRAPQSAVPALRELETFDRRLKPEGITRFSNGAREFIFMVFDTSGYAATD